MNEERYSKRSDWPWAGFLVVMGSFSMLFLLFAIDFPVTPSGRRTIQPRPELAARSEAPLRSLAVQAERSRLPRSAAPASGLRDSLRSIPTAEARRSRLAPPAMRTKRGGKTAPREAFAPADAKTAFTVGSRKGVLSGLTGKMLKHPRLVRAVFDNKYVVKGFMGRELVQRNCRSASALKGYIMDGDDPEGVKEDLPYVRAFLKNKQAAAAFAGTRMAREISDCPSVKSLTGDPAAVGQIMTANPEVAGMLADPTMLATAVTADPRAGALLASGAMGR